MAKVPSSPTPSERLYVVVSEFDTDNERYGPKRGPLVHEMYLDEKGESTLEGARKRADQLSQRYGKCRVARLEFVDE